MESLIQSCNSSSHEIYSNSFSRRTSLKAAGLSALSWLAPLSQVLGQEELPKNGKRKSQKSLIILWLAGGPSQLETFDPHPGTEIGGETKAIDTNVKGVQFAEGMEPLAEMMDSMALIRSMSSKEGDHERGTYTVKNGYRPDPTAVHPSIGSVLCHELPEETTDLPRYVSILHSQWPGRGGFLGAELDAFKANDPQFNVPDIRRSVPEDRFDKRIGHLNVIEDAFQMRRKRQASKTMHRDTVNRAVKMMTSEQVKAFKIDEEPEMLKKAYGENSFGRSCLAARRLIQVGVRCVEVNLRGWDTHVNNLEDQRKAVDVLAPAFATLIQDLKDKELWDDTIILCAGEFGRTPRINKLGGRDHWPIGFSVALAGGLIRGGTVIGETNPDPDTKDSKAKKNVKDPVSIGSLHATIMKAFDIDYTKENISRTLRPISLADGEPINKLLIES